MSIAASQYSRLIRFGEFSRELNPTREQFKNRFSSVLQRLLLTLTPFPRYISLIICALASRLMRIFPFQGSFDTTSIYLHNSPRNRIAVKESERIMIVDGESGEAHTESIYTFRIIAFGCPLLTYDLRVGANHISMLSRNLHALALIVRYTSPRFEWIMNEWIRPRACLYVTLRLIIGVYLAF